jgi:dihydroorotate dehydrogenase electron transfer subunit
MVAGGVGFPPLAYLAADLITRGVKPRQIEFFYGGKSADEIVERSRFKKLGVHFHPCTDDGSLGFKGVVTSAVESYIAENSGQKFHLYGCGPEGMLRATDDLGRRLGIPGQLSLEAPMPCGIGVCLGCVVPLRKGGHARVCVEGPVFDIGEVVL